MYDNLKQLFINVRKKYLLITTLISCFSLPLCAVEQSQISQFGITWTFDKDYAVGQFANGDYWVVGPVTIVIIQPASIELNGRTINGSMINPSPRLAHKQGYDSAMYGRYARPGSFEPNLNAARPDGKDLSESNSLTLPHNSSLVSTISTPNTDGRTQLQTAAILTVLDNPPPEGSFRPPYAGADKTIRFNKRKLNYLLLKSLKPVPGMPRLSTVERYFERPWLDHIPGVLGRCHHPLENMDDYDRDICTQTGIGALMLHLNFEDQKKETLLVRLVQLGIDNYGVIQDGGQGNWQQDSGRKFPILFAGIMLDDPNMKNIGRRSGDYAYSDLLHGGHPPSDLIRFEEDESTFYVSQSDVDMTQSPLWRPDARDAMRLPYGLKDIGLPEWGKVRLYDRTKINKYWDTTYRAVICPAWGGFVLSGHIMGMKNYWNHDAFFDYYDRYMQVEVKWKQTSEFVLNMWNTYRKNYDPVWAMSPTLEITTVGGSVTKIPDKLAYALGEKVRIKAIANPGHKFDGWTGGLSGKENPVTIIMHANMSITASFSAIGLSMEKGESLPHAQASE